MIAWMYTGQGSQQRGMGKGLFERFPETTACADAVLGYSIAELCLDDPQDRLDDTRFTQPALFVVNFLYTQARRVEGGAEPHFLLGHSLGEYNALLAADAFDFETGLRIVQERGARMSEAPEGAMLAALAAGAQVKEALAVANLSQIDVANFNSPRQTVIAGPRESLPAAREALTDRGIAVVPLKVSGAFHSRYMAPVQAAFAQFLEGFDLHPPRIPVIANATARPYPSDPAGMRDLLVRQIAGSVRWEESVRRLLDAGVEELLELGPKPVLARMVRDIEQTLDLG